MKEFLQNIDFRGRPFFLNIKGFKFVTALGGVITIITSFVFIVLTWYFGQDIYLRLKPSLVLSSGYNDGFPVYNLTSENFLFGLRIEDFYGKIIDDPSYFDYEITHEQWFYDVINSSWKLSSFVIDTMHRCNESDINPENLLKFRLNNFQCATFKNIVTGGDFSGNYLYLPSFLVKFCSSETEKKFNVKCKTKEEIKKRIPLLYPAIQFQTNILNFSNYENPIVKSFVFTYNARSVDNPTGTSLSKRIYYSLSNLISDTGFIFSDKKTTTFLEYERTDNDYPPPDFEETKDNKEIIAFYQIFLTRNSRTYERVYTKISDALASVGGIISFYSLVINILYYLYLENSYNSFIQKSIADLYCDNPQPNQINRFINPHYNEPKLEVFENKMINLDIIDKISNDNSTKEIIYKKHTLCKTNNIKSFKDNSEINQSFEKIINENMNTKKLITISKTDFFVYTYCCIKPKENAKNSNINYKLFLEYNNYIAETTDFKKYFDLKEQFKILKSLFLNESQCYMINNLSKITIIDSENNKLDKDDEKKLNSEQLHDYLTFNYRNNRLTSSDLNLFKYTNAEIKKEMNISLK